MKEIKLIGYAGKGERRENGRRGSRCRTGLKWAENPLRFPATLADAFLEVAPCEKWRDLPYSEGKNIDLTDYGSEGYRFNSCQVRHLSSILATKYAAPAKMLAGAVVLYGIFSSLGEGCHAHPGEWKSKKASNEKSHRLSVQEKG